VREKATSELTADRGLDLPSIQGSLLSFELAHQGLS
jgi:hypothetical protein